jgi:hypothetical protein
MFGLQGLRVALVRVSAPTSSGLECTGFRASEAYLKKCKTDMQSMLILARLKRLSAISRSVRVPANADERAAIEAEFSAPQFGVTEIWRARFSAWRKRLQNGRSR